MSKAAHIIYITVFVAITTIIIVALAYKGISYYRVSLEERFYHRDNNILKPSGSIGHSLGVTGSVCIILGVGSYMVRKRSRVLARLGLLKYWLEFHIFMCVLGTFLVVYHTSFKIGGIAAVSFWSMATVFASGIAGRVIYLQIPRTQQGRELDLKEVRDLRGNVMEKIRENYNLDDNSVKFITYSIEDQSTFFTGNRVTRAMKKRSAERNSLKSIAGFLKEREFPHSESSQIVALVKNDIRLGRTIERLELLKNIFRYWHVFHLPFAILMLIFMMLHVTVTVALGYRWIF